MKIEIDENTGCTLIVIIGVLCFAAIRIIDIIYR
jgi:hypothetical protein